MPCPCLGSEVGRKKPTLQLGESTVLPEENRPTYVWVKKMGCFEGSPLPSLTTKRSLFNTQTEHRCKKNGEALYLKKVASPRLTHPNPVLRPLFAHPPIFSLYRHKPLLCPYSSPAEAPNPKLGLAVRGCPGQAQSPALQPPNPHLASPLPHRTPLITLLLQTTF